MKIQIVATFVLIAFVGFCVCQSDGYAVNAMMRKDFFGNSLYPSLSHHYHYPPNRHYTPCVFCNEFDFNCRYHCRFCEDCRYSNNFRNDCYKCSLNVPY